MRHTALLYITFPNTTAYYISGQEKYNAYFFTKLQNRCKKTK